ncbi:MAG: hypothetical protein PHN19_03170 [Patescibacteria group bacterium]|nr:hypothetical protein [Patescibacteria group bacterium]
MENNKQSTQCCPKFNPELWDNKIITWNNKKFIKDKVFTLFHMPINFGSVMKRITEKVEKNKVNIPGYLCLSDHTSKWNMDVYLAVDKEVPDAENITLNGKYLSKVYEGNFKDTGKWSEDFKNFAKEKGFNIKKWYMWYTTCPKCAKKYGKNYVAIIAQIG